MRKRLLCGWIATLMFPLAGIISACASPSVQQTDASSLSQAFPAVFENSDSTKDSQHTFTFVGGADMSGSLTQLRGGFANYVRLFEEDIRGFWNDPTNSYSTPWINYYQRYVFDNSYAGASLGDILNDWWRVTITDPETVVYLVGREDYQTADDTYVNQLLQLIQKALALRNNNGYLVLQKHWTTNDANANQTIQKYNALIDEAINRATLNNWAIERIVVVDHEKQTSTRPKTI